MALTALPPNGFLTDIWRTIRLELGAGSGLVGLAVALGCRVDGTVLLTDQTDMMSLMEHNIIGNSLQGAAKALVLNWYGFIPIPDNPAPCFT